MTPLYTPIPDWARPIAWVSAGIVMAALDVVLWRDVRKGKYADMAKTNIEGLTPEQEDDLYALKGMFMCTSSLHTLSPPDKVRLQVAILKAMQVVIGKDTLDKPDLPEISQEHS